MERARPLRFEARLPGVAHQAWYAHSRTLRRRRERGGVEHAEPDLRQAQLDCDVGDQVDLLVGEPRVVVSKLRPHLDPRLGAIGYYGNVGAGRGHLVWHRRMMDERGAARSCMTIGDVNSSIPSPCDR